VLALVWSIHPVAGQLVFVRCCTEQRHLDAMPDCVSGDGNLTRPEQCPAGAVCVLGFAGATPLAARLCDPRLPTIPEFTRAHCSTWTDDTTPAVFECVANPVIGVDLFSVMDDDGDGDLDETDVAEFEQFREVVPKVVQSEAVLSLIECCVPSDVLRLSGPGVTAVPLAATCMAGFSEPVEPGDYQYELCGEAPRDASGPTSSFCQSWQLEELPPSFYCPAADFTEETMFIVADTDGDDDVDLVDYASFQQDWTGKK